MSTPRPSEADVEALPVEASRALLVSELRECIAVCQPVEYGRIPASTLAEAAATTILASDWLAARDAEREREVAGWRGIAQRRERLHDLLAEAEGRAEAAERALADLRGEIKALADEWEAEFFAFRRDDPAHLSIRALLPRDDAAGAGGAG